MAFLFQRPPVAHVPAPTFNDTDTDIARVSEKLWNALLLPEDEKITFSIERCTGNKGTGRTGLPSITCQGVLDRTVSTWTALSFQSNILMSVSMSLGREYFDPKTLASRVSPHIPSQSPQLRG